MKTGIELISEERREQIEKHGFTDESDSQYVNCELEQGALHAIEPSMFRVPETWGGWFEEKMKQKDEVERLIVAGALIAAAIDRLNPPRRTWINNLNKPGAVRGKYGESYKRKSIQ